MKPEKSRSPPRARCGRVVPKALGRLVGLGFGVPDDISGLSGYVVDVSGVAWGNFGEYSVWSVLACGETGLS